MSSQSKIWFLLVNSNGQPYNGCDVGSLRLSTSYDISDFRDAVKAKFDDSFLKGTASTALKVYKNMDAFSKKEAPLRASSTLNGLGMNEDNALLVLVPSKNKVSYREISKLMEVGECEILFYNNICNAAELDAWLLFKQDIPSSTLNRLFVRECYQTIASSINPDLNKIIISGTPGIGKSLFLIYLLWKLVKDGKRVLFIYHPATIYYDGRGAVFHFPGNSLPSYDDADFWSADLWCLFDAKEKEKHDLSKIPYELCTFVLSTSPRREMVNDFKKPPTPQVFYMPLWTETELETIAPCFPKADNWHHRFNILGGIPRHVLEDTKSDPTKLLQAACEQCDLDDCIKIIGLDSTITDKAKVIHSLVHMTSAHPFTESSVTFSSQTALNIIVQRKGIKAKRRMEELLASCEGNPLTAALCGYIFEPYAIELLEKGDTFNCRQLLSGNKKMKLDETSIDKKSILIPPSVRQVVDKVSPDQVTKQLYVPKTKNYTAIDAWIPGIGAFQMTVGKKHDIKGGAGEDLAMLGQGANKLYWLLPPLYYESFTKKSPQDIDQYAVLIPYPSVKVNK